MADAAPGPVEPGREPLVRTPLLRGLRGCALGFFVLLAACGRHQPLPSVEAAPASASSAAQPCPAGEAGDARQCYDLSPSEGKTISLAITDTTYALGGSPSGSVARTEEMSLLRGFSLRAERQRKPGRPQAIRALHRKKARVAASTAKVLAMLWMQKPDSG